MFENKARRFQARRDESELERWSKLNDKKVPEVTLHHRSTWRNELFTYCPGVWIHKGVELLLLPLLP